MLCGNHLNALVFSKLLYCCTVWSGTSKTNVKKLQRVQSFALRLVTKANKYDHITPLLHQLQWLPVKSILLFKEGVLAFKCVKGLAPSYLTARFNKRSTVHDKVTRNKDSLIIPHYKSTSGQRTFSYRGIRLWNSFPIELCELNKIGRFKRELKVSGNEIKLLQIFKTSCCKLKECCCKLKHQKCACALKEEEVGNRSFLYF